jgi:hypothetical protein
MQQEERQDIGIKSRNNMKKLLSIFKFFAVQFGKFYGLRALLSLVQGLMKINFKAKNFSFLLLYKCLFNESNLRTGLFLSVMPALFKLFNYFFELLVSKDNLIGQILFTFLSGFIASFLGISISEKTNIMVFVILSALVRSIHSLIVVFLKKHNIRTTSKTVTFFVFLVVCFGFLFLGFYHPEFKQISALMDRYGNVNGTEVPEIWKIRNAIKLV